ncbi:MAG: NAD-glutamate dehydrogenase, partial [Solirubrobacterales bacterium]|nr:NAD-glutamate dehydrogenase [Solirubrobacterales bacterium]
QVAGLNRELEFLPDEETIAARKTDHQGLVAPELAVVMAYCKIRLYSLLLDSDLPEDPHLAHDLERYFPPPLPERYAEQMHTHRLRREIIATAVANQLVDRGGTTFAFRLSEETSAPPSILARGFAVARDVFEMRSYWSAVQELDNRVEAQTQLAMLIEGRRLVERATRWLVRANPSSLDIAQTSEHFASGAQMVAEALPGVLEGSERDAFDARVSELSDAGAPHELARRVAGLPSLLFTFDIVEVADATGHDPNTVMEIYFKLGSGLQLNWLRDRIIELPRANRWQALARAALRDDLYSLHRAITREVISDAGAGTSSDAAIEAWWERNRSLIDRCLGMLGDIRGSRSYDTTTLPVALREVRNLIRGSVGTGGVAGADSVTMAG